MALLRKLKQRARELKVEAFALYLAARGPRTPWCARLLVAGIAAYAFSPIDLIPDFVPVLGYLDDLVLIPIGIGLALKLVPDSVLSERRARAPETYRASRDNRLTLELSGSVKEARDRQSGYHAVVLNRLKIFIESLSKNERVYLAIMGIVHGATNLGGSLLTAIIHSKHYEKNVTRVTIAASYATFAAFQILTLMFSSKLSNIDLVETGLYL